MQTVDTSNRSYTRSISCPDIQWQALNDLASDYGFNSRNAIVNALIKDWVKKPRKIEDSK